MKPKYYILLLLLLPTINLMANDWTRVLDLRGTWLFSIGDDVEWSKQEVDTKAWDPIRVPANWDDYYEGYNGYGWYRKTFDIRQIPDNKELVLFLGRIDDVGEIFINGVKIGQSGAFLPHLKTAWDKEVQLRIPNGLLMKSGNTIAVRVYDEGHVGGIVNGNKMGIYIDNDVELLSLDLSGKWKFSTYREKEVNSIDFDDHKWNEINVPGKWEDQGYAEHDGYAWYRKKFTIPATLKKEQLYVVLGKIDDYDKVYLNGHFLSRTEYIDTYSRLRKYRAWLLYRVYKLPMDDLKSDNVLVVEVRDDGVSGGIYEGPVGIMNDENAQLIEERNLTGFWDDPLQYLFDYFD
jgi:sialate O-acetylesterase